MNKFYSIVAVAFLLINFSCSKDHELPPAKIYPVIKTVSEFQTRSNGTEYYFGVEFVDLGNIPIKSYGVRYSSILDPRSGSLNFYAARGIFTGVPELGVIKQWIPRDISQSTYWPVNYYCAYVEVENRIFIYGDIKAVR